MQINESEQKALDILWKNYKESADIDLRDKLIVHYLHLVKFVVARIAAGLPTHIKLDDLYSSGITGLMKSIEKFDIEKKSKFESYAMLLIKGSIIDELRALDWIPRSVHQKANQIAAAQHDLQQKLGREPYDNEIAERLGMSTLEFEELLYRVRPAILIPLNAEFDQDSEQASLSERIADCNARTSFEIADRKEFNHFLEQAVHDLPEQERRVLFLYYYEEMMLKEIGKLLGVSESRVSQIHTKALFKLRNRLNNSPYAVSTAPPRSLRL